MICYPNRPQPKEAVQRMEKTTRMIIVRSSDFIWLTFR